jgi:hypothetical protein
VGNEIGLKFQIADFWVDKLEGRAVTVQRVVAYHISRLKHKDAQVRLNAIKELELIGAEEALEELQAVFRADADNEVRKAAQAAGRAIFLKRQQANNE